MSSIDDGRRIFALAKDISDQPHLQWGELQMGAVWGEVVGLNVDDFLPVSDWPAPVTADSTPMPTAIPSHRLAIEYDGEYAKATLLCEAPSSSPCRSVPSCECERLTAQRDDKGWFHMALVYDDQDQETEERHDHDEPTDCWIADNMTNGDGAMFYGEAGQGVIATLPVSIAWDGDDWLWKVVKP